MSDKAREWWLYQCMRTGSTHFSDEQKQESEYLRFMNHVIEHSAFEQVVRERDEWIARAEKSAKFKQAHEHLSREHDITCAERDKLRAAVEFYANEELWTDNDMKYWDTFDCTTMGQDLGERAREALK